MSSRESILANLRKTVSRDARDQLARKKRVSERLEGSPNGIIPQRGQVAPKARAKLFCEEAKKVSATVKRVKSYDRVPAVVAEYLRQNNLPASVRMGTDNRLAKLDWASRKSLEVTQGPTDGSDQVGLSHAYGGVAETGTLMLVSGPENPSTVNFLPENHIVVIDSREIDGDYESVLARIRKKYAKKGVPRTINMITGPSRSADIQQTLFLGAHGPKKLHIIVVGD